MRHVTDSEEPAMSTRKSSRPPGAGEKSASGPNGDIGRERPYDEEPEVPEGLADDQSPGADIARGGMGSVEPNEPA